MVLSFEMLMLSMKPANAGTVTIITPLSHKDQHMTLGCGGVINAQLSFGFPS